MSLGAVDRKTPDKIVEHHDVPNEHQSALPNMASEIYENNGLQVENHREQGEGSGHHSKSNDTDGHGNALGHQNKGQADIINTNDDHPAEIILDGHKSQEDSSKQGSLSNAKQGDHEDTVKNIKESSILNNKIDNKHDKLDNSKNVSATHGVGEPDYVGVASEQDDKNHHGGVIGAHESKDKHEGIVGVDEADKIPVHENKPIHETLNSSRGAMDPHGTVDVGHENKEHLSGLMHDNEAKDNGKSVGHAPIDKDHSAPTDGGRETEDGNGSEIGSNTGSSYSDRRHKVVYIYSPPTKRTTGGHGGASSGGGGGVHGNSKLRGSVTVVGSGARGKNVTTAKSQHQQQLSQGSSQQQTKSPVVTRSTSPQRRNQPSDRPSPASTGPELATKRPPSQNARPTTASSAKKIGGDSAVEDAETHDGKEEVGKHRDGAAGSSFVSEDDSNIYKRNLLQVKEELNQMKERAVEVQSARRQARRVGSSKKSNKSSFHALDDFDCSRSYCDTQVLDFYIKKDTTHRYYPVAKVTATTLLDPWDDLAQQRPAERVRRLKPYQPAPQHHHKQHSRPQSHHQQHREDAQHPQQEPLSTNGGGGGDGGSPRRRIPLLPVVDFSATAEYWRRPLYFDELPVIRSRIREAHSSSGRRRRQLDYARTAEECRSLELDSLDRVPGRRSRTSLARCCSAYMGTRPGSRAALGDCLERVRHWWEPATGGEDAAAAGGVVVPPSSGRRSRQQQRAAENKQQQQQQQQVAEA